MLEWSLDGADKDRFALGTDSLGRTIGTSAQLITRAPLDHEAGHGYSVTLVVRDIQQDESARHDLSVVVTDVDEPPEKPPAPTLHARTRTSLTVSWAAPPNDGRPDIESYDLQYRAGTSGPFTDGPQGVTGTRAEIGSLQPVTSYQVRVRATNAEGTGAWSDPLSAATDPSVSIATRSGGGTVTEGTDAAAVFVVSRTGATTETLTVTVAVTESGDWIDGAAPTTVAFAAGASTAALSVPLDDDVLAEPDGSITATLSAGTGYQVDASARSATVTVIDDETPNAPPVFSAGLPASVEVAENTVADTSIGPPFTATDADGTALSWSLAGTDEAHFAIDASSGQLKTKGALNHEAKASHSVSVEVSDGRATASHAVTVNVTDVDEPPGRPAAPTLSGRTRTSLTVAWVDSNNAGRPEVASHDLQYRVNGTPSWTAGPQDVTGSPTRIGSLGAATVYAVRVRATNAEGDSPWSEPLAVATDPSVSIAARSGGETVTEGTDAAAVFVVSRTGETDSALPVSVSVTRQGDFVTGPAPTGVTIAAGEASAELSMAIDDDGRHEADGSITVALSAATAYAVDPGGKVATVSVRDHPNAGPVITTTSPIEVEEGSSLAVATLAATDADGDDLVWSIAGGADAAAFALTTAGALTFATAVSYEAPADADRDNDYVVVVRASDGTEHAELALTVTVTSALTTPAVTGVAQVGAALEASLDGTMDGLAWQWLRGTDEITGATSATYTPSAADVGRRLSVRVSRGDASATSEATVPVWPAPANPPLGTDETELLSTTLTLEAWDGRPDPDGGLRRACPRPVRRDGRDGVRRRGNAPHGLAARGQRARRHHARDGRGAAGGGGTGRVLERAPRRRARGDVDGHRPPRC